MTKAVTKDLGNTTRISQMSFILLIVLQNFLKFVRDGCRVWYGWDIVVLSEINTRIEPWKYIQLI